MPIRIQRKRTEGWKMPENTVYVGRGSKWGNPYRLATPEISHHNLSIYVKNSIEGVIEAYTHYIHKPIQIMGSLVSCFTSLAEEARRELKGKNLACWCRLDQPCHADVLLEKANAESGGV